MVERDLMVPTTSEKSSIRPHMRGGKTHVHDFWQTHWFRDEIPTKCYRVEKTNDRQILNGSITILVELLPRR